MKKQPKPNIGRLGPYTGPRGKYHVDLSKYNRRTRYERITQYTEYYSPTSQEKPSES